MLYSESNYSDQTVAANIKHAVGTADQLTDDLSMCRSEGVSAKSSSNGITKNATAPTTPVSPISDYIIRTISNSPTSPISSIKPTGSAGSFNSAAFLASNQRSMLVKRSCNQSVLWNLPNEEDDNEESDICKVFPNENLENHKEKKINKRFGIVNIGKNVAK